MTVEQTLYVITTLETLQDELIERYEAQMDVIAELEEDLTEVLELSDSF